MTLDARRIGQDRLGFAQHPRRPRLGFAYQSRPHDSRGNGSANRAAEHEHARAYEHEQLNRYRARVDVRHTSIIVAEDGRAWYAQAQTSRGRCKRPGSGRSA